MISFQLLYYVRNVGLTCGIAVRKGEIAIAVFECGRVPDDLVHQTWEADRVALRAVASHDKIGECNMVLVVLAVDSIATFPARGEHDLKTNTIRAVGIKVGLVREIVAV